MIIIVIPIMAIYDDHTAKNDNNDRNDTTNHTKNILQVCSVVTFHSLDRL